MTTCDGDDDDDDDDDDDQKKKTHHPGFLSTFLDTYDKSSHLQRLPNKEPNS